MKSFLLHLLRITTASIALFVAVLTALFFLLELAPGDPIQTLVGDTPISPEFREQIVATYKLDLPVWQRYLAYMGNVFTGDFGYSFGTNNEPVLDLIMDRAGNTLALGVPAFILSTLGGTVLGALGGRTRRKWLDDGISGSAVALFSVPNFWLGLLLIMIFSVSLGWFPMQGKSPYGESGINWQYAVLPVIAMATTELAYKTRIMRSSMIEALGQDFIDTARSKGLSSRQILWRHALPNALLPMVTVAGYSLGFLFAGSALVESVFGWPGMGLLLVNAIHQQNNMVVLGVVIILTVTILLVNILTDITYGVIDPRIRESFRSGKKLVTESDRAGK